MSSSINISEQVPEARSNFGSRLWLALRIYALAVFGTMFAVGLYLSVTDSGQFGRISETVRDLLTLFAISAINIRSLIRDGGLRNLIREIRKPRLHQDD
jgi:hypothetical protein